MKTAARCLSICLLPMTIVLFSISSPSSAGTYKDSAHGGYNTAGKGVSRLTGYAAGNCAHCHEQHASVSGVSSTPAPYVLFDTLSGNAVCNTCHDLNQSNGADDIASQIALTHSHVPNSGAYLVATGKELTCEKCHNSHVAQTTPHVEGSAAGNTVSSVLAGLSGLAVSFAPPGTPTAGSELLGSTSLGTSQPITMEYELCLQCHEGSMSANGLEDIGRQVNPGNFSAHPVATSTWKNSFLTTNYATAFNFPWNAAANRQMYCSDCHGGNTTPVGPHGSNNISMLRTIGPGASYDNLCTSCHNTASSGWVDTWGTATVGDHSLAAHQYSAVNNPTGCLACHGGINDALESSVHGGNYTWPLEGANPGRNSYAMISGGGLITKNYYVGSDTPGNRYCNATCHTAVPAGDDGVGGGPGSGPGYQY